MLVNGKPLEEFVAENETALIAGAIARKAAMQARHAGWRDELPQTANGRQSSGGVWKGDVPRNAKHKPAKVR